MATKYIRIKVNGLVKSDQTNKRCIDFSYQKTYGDAVSNSTITLKRQFGSTGTTEDDTDFISGKHVQVWQSDTLTAGEVAETSGNIVFDGYVEDREIEHFKVTLICSDRLVLARWSETGTVTYTTNTSVKTIFQDIINTVQTSSGLTFTVAINAAATSPVNLNKYVLENNNCYEKLWELANIVNWQFYYDPVNDRVVFEPRGTPVNQDFANKTTGTGKDQNGNTVNWSGKTLNAAGLIRWQTDSKDLTNNFVGIGGQTEVNVVQEPHTVTGATFYTLTDTNAGGRNTNTQIYNVTVESLSPAHTFINGTDYTVKTSSSPPGFIALADPSVFSGYTTVYFTYTYKQNASSGVTTSDATSISNYIKRTKTVTKRNIVSPTDVSNYLSNLLSGFKNPITDISFETRDSLVTPIVGSLATIYDGIINRVIVSTGTPVPIITRTVKHWPQPTTTVTVSTKPIKYENQTQTYFDRIDKTDKELTKTNANPNMKLDGSTPFQGDLIFGTKSDGTLPQIMTPVMQNLASDPLIATKGQLYFNTVSNTFKGYNGTSWGSIGGGSVGPGTTNNIAKFTSSTNVGNSILTDNGSTVTLTGTSTLDLNSNQIIGVTSITSANVATGVRLFFFGDGSPGLQIVSAACRTTKNFAFRVSHSADDCYIKDDASGTMEIHVPAGQKLKVVVG